MKPLHWIKWLLLFWSLFLLAFFAMWLFYLWDKFGDFSDFFKPLPRDMGYEAQNAATWMYVASFFPDLLFVIIPYWAATLGFWMKAKSAIMFLTFATGGWFYSALNNWMCQFSLGAKNFFPGLVNEILLSFTIPVLLMIMAIIYYRDSLKEEPE